MSGTPSVSSFCPDLVHLPRDRNIHAPPLSSGQPSREIRRAWPAAPEQSRVSRRPLEDEGVRFKLSTERLSDRRLKLRFDSASTGSTAILIIGAVVSGIGRSGQAGFIGKEGHELVLKMRCGIHIDCNTDDPCLSLRSLLLPPVPPRLIMLTAPPKGPVLPIFCLPEGD